MEDPQEVPLDERSFNDARLVQSMGGIHTNTVLHYFSHSPFHDPTSNNATLTTQANYNPSLVKYVETREAFEGQLRTMSGLEFMVAFEPQREGEWVIRKQNRRKRHGMEDEVTVLGTYFIIGETIYTAPTAGDVIASRLLSTVSSLTKFLGTVSSLPNFSPARGYTYAPPLPKTSTSVPGSQLSQNSQEPTPMPDALGRAGRPANSTTALNTNTAAQGAKSLAESLNLTVRYRGEYMDENPLVGEPGSFILASTHGQTTTTSKSQARAQAAKKTPVAPTSSQTQGATVPATATGRKGSKTGEKSPTPPAAPPKPKRKKSKAAVNTSTASPT